MTRLISRSIPRLVRCLRFPFPPVARQWCGEKTTSHELRKHGSSLRCVCVCSRSGTFHKEKWRYTLHYITYIASSYVMLPCLALHCIALHCITLYYITLHYIRLHTYIYIYIYIYIHNYPQTPCVAQTLTLRMLCCRI